jgi:hypothetical protein
MKKDIKKIKCIKRTILLLSVKEADKMNAGLATRETRPLISCEVPCGYTRYC